MEAGLISANIFDEFLAVAATLVVFSGDVLLRLVVCAGEFTLWTRC